MLKHINAEIISSIEEYTVNAKNKYISIQIATGSVVDGAFISDGRGLITHRIVNVPDRPVQQIDTLTVDAAGQVTLSLMPIDNNPVLINDVSVDHAVGQLVVCGGHAEGDVITAAYYYTRPGRNWFDEQAAFVKEDHLWSILLEMGLVIGEVI